MKYTKRAVIAGIGGMLAGCLDRSDEPNTADGSDTDDSGNEGGTDSSENNKTMNEDVPYDDIAPNFSLVGRITAEERVQSGFDVLTDDRFATISVYQELFVKVESVAENEREEGVVISTSVDRDSQEGVEVRETIAELHDEMDWPNHSEDGGSNVWGTHYIEHDDLILRTSLQTPGTPE